MNVYVAIFYIEISYGLLSMEYYLSSFLNALLFLEVRLNFKLGVCGNWELKDDKKKIGMVGISGSVLDQLASPLL